MPYQTNKPRENHARIVRALDLCSDIYRDIILKKIVPIEDLKSRAEGRTRFYESLSRDEKANIKISSRRKTLENLDLSIMYKILRHVCIIPAPKTGWGTRNLISPHVELADDIERIRFIRNETAGHSPRPEIEDATFNIFLNELSLVIERMDRRNSKQYTESLDEILHCSMNAQVEVIKSITKDAQCLFNNKFHCRTDRIADEVQRRLLENNCIILTGIGGCGKTTVAKQAVKELSSMISIKDVYFVNTVDEFSSVVGLVDSQVVLIDDPFGKSNLNKTEFDSWKRHFPKMESLVKSKKIFFLLTCRKSILENVRGSTDSYDIFNKKNTMDLSTEWNFTIAEKKYFLDESVKYSQVEVYDSRANLSHQLAPWNTVHGCSRAISEFENQNFIKKGKITSSLIDSVSKRTPRIGFPQACHLFFSNWDFFKQGLDFFVKADESLVREINSIRARSPEDYAILVYVLLQSNHEIDTKGKYEMELIERICHLLGIVKLSPVKLHDKVEFELSSLYLQKKGSESYIYTFQHESILESVLLSFCQFFAQDFLELAPFDTIRHFIRPSFHQTQPGEICCLLPPTLDRYLVCLYGENIIEKKTSIDDLWIICEFREEHLQCLLDSLRERGIDYIYQKTKNIRKRFRLCNDTIRKYLASKKACTLITVILTMFPDVLFEYISLQWSTLIILQRGRDVFRTILECTFSSVMLLYKDLSDESYLTGLVKLLWVMSESDLNNLTFEVMRGMDNLITEIGRLSCQKTEFLFWSVVIKNFHGRCGHQIYMGKIFIEKVSQFFLHMDFGALLRSGDVKLLEYIEKEMQKEKRLVDSIILEFIRRIPDMILHELIERQLSAGIVCFIDHALKLVAGHVSYKMYNNCVSWFDFMKDDPSLVLSKLCKRVPNFVTFRTFKSAVSSGAVEFIRLLILFEYITDIHLQALSEPWQNNEEKDISWNELLERDDGMVLFLLIQKFPQIIMHTTVQAAIETGAINSLKVILSYAKEANSRHAVIQKILESDTSLTIDYSVKVWKILFEKNDLNIMCLLLKVIDTQETDNGHVVRQAIREMSQKGVMIHWRRLLEEDDAEVMSLLVKTIPQIITDRTFHAAIETGAVNSLKVIFKYDNDYGLKMTKREMCQEEDNPMYWIRLLKKDDTEVMGLLVRKFPQIITYRTSQAAIIAGAVNSIRVLLATENKKGIDHEEIRKELVWWESKYPSNWRNLFENDDVEVTNFVVRHIPQTITPWAIQAAIETGAIKSLKVILTTENEACNDNELKMIKRVWQKCPPIYWSRLLAKDDTEVMSLLVRKIPQIITYSTIQVAIETGAVNSIRVLATENEMIIREMWQEEGAPIYWNRLLEKDDVEIMSLLTRKTPPSYRTVRAAIETGAVNSFKLLYQRDS